MRSTTTLLLAFLASLALHASSAQAVPYHPWCARYFDISGATVCAFDSQAQCLANVSGVGGSCMSNAAPPPYGYPAYGPRARRTKRHYDRER